MARLKGGDRCVNADTAAAAAVAKDARSSGSQSDSDGECCTPSVVPAADAAAAVAAVDANGRKRKRKATYHVRRDEIDVLQTRVADLEHELRALKYQALVQQTPSSQATNGDPYTSTKTLAKDSYTKNFLRDALQSQQFALAGLQALVSSYSCLQELSPIHTPIRLGHEPQQRQQTLVAVRERVLNEAKRFLAERSRGLDVFKVFTEQERYETDDDDYCALGFDIVPLGASHGRSVKRVFDTLFFQIRNIEITFSEMMGHIAIRENDDSGDAWLSQHRLVSAIAKDVVIETNAVIFADFERATGTGDGSDFGIIVLEWVDDDALYPYRPKERVRRDTSCIFTVQVHSRKRRRSPAAASECMKPADEAPAGGEDKEGAEENETSVVLMRWSQTKLHRASVRHDVRVVQEMRASIGTWGDRMVQAMYESAHSSPAKSATVNTPGV